MLQWIANSMTIIAIAVISYVICLAVDKKPIAQLVVLVSVMLFVLTTITDLTPTIRRIGEKANSIEQKIDRIAGPMESIRNTKEKIEQNPIINFGMPRN